MTIFEQAFKMTVGVEGGYGTDKNDSGNWTGGAVGKGELRGTKYGISAASYPTLDIKNLTLNQAEDIYKKNYWGAMQCDSYKPQLAVLIFDAAVNCGVGAAAKFLKIAVSRSIVSEQCKEFQAQRLNYMSGLSAWKMYGLGWSRRLVSVYDQAMKIGQEAEAPAPVAPTTPAKPTAPQSAVTIENKKIIQAHCKYDDPEAVWTRMDTHPFADALYDKWAKSYKESEATN